MQHTTEDVAVFYWLQYSATGIAHCVMSGELAVTRIMVDAHSRQVVRTVGEYEVQGLRKAILHVRTSAFYKCTEV